jgi:predicted AlkP superfamily pyrophosphatase or phosphodiesterase
LGAAVTRRRLLVAVGLAVLAGCAHIAAAPVPARHLVLISLDGLRPAFYLDHTYPAPTLRALVRDGSHARQATPVFPSVTYPGHASIATGVRPARHGVLFNVIWTPAGGPSRWYEEAADLRTPALWDVARASGLTTAAVSWPSTLGARIDWLVPERDYYQRTHPLELLRQAVTPGLLERLGTAPRASMFRNVAEWDDFLTRTAVALIRGMRPNLLLLHLVQLDYYQHRGGTHAPELASALVRVDTHLARLLAALREAGIQGDTTVIVVGDHGFQDVASVVHVNEILAQAGVGGCHSGEWRATAFVTGGSAGVFARSAEDAAAAEAVLRREARDRYTIVSRAELDALGAMTGAAFALDAAPGWALAPTCGVGVESAHRSGTHGSLPSRPAMSTGFVAAGRGVRPGVTLERIELVDVAPTAAHLLGVQMTGVDGRVLTEILR